MGDIEIIILFYWGWVGAKVQREWMGAQKQRARVRAHTHTHTHTHLGKCHGQLGLFS